MMTAKHAVLTLLVASALVLPGGSALAKWQAPGALEPLPAPTASQDRVTRSYGIQILLADVAVVGATVATEEGGVLLGGYLLSGPLVHAANGNGKKVFGSLLLRAGMPLGGMVLGAAAADVDCEHSDEMFCGLGHIAIGMLAGMITASVIDAAVLARKTTKAERTPSVFSVGGVAANPDLRVNREGSVTLGLSGNF